MSLKKLADATRVGGQNDLTKVLGAVAVAGSLYSAFGPKKKVEDKPDLIKDDPFSLAKFTAELNSDARRVAKGHYYYATMWIPGNSQALSKKLTFQCSSINLPGWRAKTQTGKIYGLSYEIATEIEQDPLWMTFNIDIRHQIEELFMNTAKGKMFSLPFLYSSGSVDEKSYSPMYKQDYEFGLSLHVTDEAFQETHIYTFKNCMIKTVQQVQYGAGDIDPTKVSVEVVYEEVVVDVKGKAREVAKENKPPKNKNQLKLGPFQADISGVNQLTDGVSKVPDWFKSPSSI